MNLTLEEISKRKIEIEDETKVLNEKISNIRLSMQNLNENEQQILKMPDIIEFVKQLKAVTNERVPLLKDLFKSIQELVNLVKEEDILNKRKLELDNIIKNNEEKINNIKQEIEDIKQEQEKNNEYLKTLSETNNITRPGILIAIENCAQAKEQKNKELEELEIHNNNIKNSIKEEQKIVLKNNFPFAYEDIEKQEETDLSVIETNNETDNIEDNNIVVDNQEEINKNDEIVEEIVPVPEETNNINTFLKIINNVSRPDLKNKLISKIMSDGVEI